jgi:hypothetical protein
MVCRRTAWTQAPARTRSRRRGGDFSFRHRGLCYDAIVSTTRLTALLLILGAIACGSRTSTPAADPIENTATPAGRPGLPTGAVTADSLKALIKARFPEQVASGAIELDLGPGDSVAEEILDEVSAMGVETLEQLGGWIPEDYETRAAHVFSGEYGATNVAGLVRDFLMIHDVRRYFDQAFQEHWQQATPDTVRTLEAYGVDLTPLRAHGLLDEGGYEEGGYDEGYDEPEDPCAGD